MKKFFLKIIPWVITAFALHYAFKGVPVHELTQYLTEANKLWLSVAIVLTFLSYFLRSYRWRFFFAENKLSFFNSFKVLIIGFFMNNILPARAGEIIRAHLGAKLTNEKRTLVLATIASERLADGVMISFMFIAYAILHADNNNSTLLYVAALFIVALICVFLMLCFQTTAFKVLDKISAKINKPFADYALGRMKIFIGGLNPLLDPERIPKIIISSSIIWSIELLAYYSISHAFNSSLTLFGCIIFLAAVNFSSMVPAAPGGIGVIEAFAKSALVSVGIEQNLALAMVITQHFIQYMVIAVPGVFCAYSYMRQIKAIKKELDDNEPNLDEP